MADAGSQLTLQSTVPMPASSAPAAPPMPILGLGVYQIRDPGACEAACAAALAAGYRHIDTAQLYRNEAEVGRGVRASDVPRGDVFITTKIIRSGGSPEKTYARVVESVDRIDPRNGDDGGDKGEAEGGYVDLFLVHTPWRGLKERRVMWLALERLLEEGKAKAIGVSNYEIEHIEEMRSYARVWPPAVNQIELHPWRQQRGLVAYCKEHGIVVQAYSPLVQGEKLGDPTLVAVAEKYSGKTPAQILIRYCLQKGWVPLPKSDKAGRIRENASAFDFEISDEDMERLDALDER